MAQIDIQHKRGINPIWWVLAIVILIAIAWWLIAANNDRDAESTTAVAADAPGMIAEGPVTDVTNLVDASTAAGFAGRTVQIASAPVQRVVSDRGFWIGPSGERSVFVVRANQSSPVTPPDGAVNQGQHVAVYGRVERVPANLADSTTAWNLASTESNAITTLGVYVSADSVHIIER